MSWRIRAVEDHEIETFASCVDAAFGVSLEGDARDRFVEGLASEELIGCFDDEALVGTLSLGAVKLTLPERRASEAMLLSNVAVLPTHRRRGVCSALVNEALDIAQRRESTFVVLGANSGRLYRRFGFGPATWLARCELASGARLDSSIVREGASLVLLSVEEANALLPSLYDELARNSPGEINRTRRWWEDFIASATDASLRRFYLVYLEDGHAEGYAIYDVGLLGEDGDGRAVRVLELRSSSSRAEAALVETLLGLDATTLRFDERPVDDPLRHALRDGRDLRVLEVREALWLRVIDVERALAARDYGATGSLVIEVADDRFADNTGRFRLGHDATSVKVERSDAPPELRLDVASLASAFLGGSSFRTLRAAGRVEEVRRGSCARADELFVAEAAFTSGVA